MQCIKVHCAAFLFPESPRIGAASGIDRFDELLERSAARAPIHHLVGLEDVEAVAAFLVGDWAKSPTGSTTYVDAGHHIIG
ncbi:MAG TPA: SDR family oxidoreductase [Isosphaeraceae bacterium]|nr:SDR family oxidoreductase [Isosphaeraceae bacterium]